MYFYKNKNYFLFFVVLFIFSTINNVIIANQPFLENTNQIAALNQKKMRIAICYWGLTRSTKKVYTSHYQNLFNILTKHNLEYDVFMHTWRTKGKQRIWNWHTDVPIDYEEYKLLEPRFYQIDDQDEFTNHLDFDKYYYGDFIERRLDPGWSFDIRKDCILNHLCALESLKRVTEMVENTGNKYDLVIYVRPDIMLNNELPIEKIITSDFDIYIPDFDHVGGYNDRFAVLVYKAASIYGKRIRGLAEFRRTHGYIHSETYVKYVCDANHLKVVLMPFYFDIIRP